MMDYLIDHPEQEAAASVLSAPIDDTKDTNDNKKDTDIQQEEEPTTAFTFFRNICPKISQKVQSIKSAVIDSGATGTYMRPEDGAIPTGKPSTKRVSMPDGRETKASEEALLPMTQLNDEARRCDILPALSTNSLISVSKLVAAGYTVIFDADDKNVKVYQKEDIKFNPSAQPILRGWQEGNGLWRIPLVDKVVNNEKETVLLYKPNVNEEINNVYDLPSIEQSIRWRLAWLFKVDTY